MKPPVPADTANDNGKPEDHLASATMALHKAMDGLDAPVKVIQEALAVARSVDPTKRVLTSRRSIERVRHASLQDFREE